MAIGGRVAMVALVAACLIKLTALISVAVVIVVLRRVGAAPIARRDRARNRDRRRDDHRDRILLLHCMAREFLFQTFVFHLMKGRTDLLGGDGFIRSRSSTSKFRFS